MALEQSFITVTDKAAEKAKAILTKCGVASAGPCACSSSAAVAAFTVSGHRPRAQGR